VEIFFRCSAQDLHQQLVANKLINDDRLPSHKVKAYDDDKLKEKSHRRNVTGETTSWSPGASHAGIRSGHQAIAALSKY